MFLGVPFILGTPPIFVVQLYVESFQPIIPGKTHNPMVESLIFPYMGVSWNRGTPKSSMSFSDFPWNKSSSYWVPQLLLDYARPRRGWRGGWRRRGPTWGRWWWGTRQGRRRRRCPHGGNGSHGGQARLGWGGWGCKTSYNGGIENGTFMGYTWRYRDTDRMI